MLSSQEIDLIENLEKIHATKIVAVHEDDFNSIIEMVEKSISLENYDEVGLYCAYRIKGSNEDCYLIITDNEYSIQTGKTAPTFAETQLMGIKILQNSYGNIYVRPESFADKISELFKRTVIDYKHFPKFSSKYFLQASNRNLCDSFANNRRLGLIENQKEISIHVKENLLTAKFNRQFNAADFGHLIEFLTTI